MPSRVHGLWLPVVLLVLTGWTGGVQELPLQVDVDHAAFAYSDTESILEVYFAFGADKLPYEETPDGFRASLPVEILLRPSSMTTLEGRAAPSVWQDTLHINFFVADTLILQPGQHFLHQVRTVVQPGTYELEVVVPEDAARNRPELMLRRDVSVPVFLGDNRVRLSDVTLAAGMEASQEREDPFYKNGLLIRPNPNQLYGAGLGQLYYYAEAYNANQVGGPGGQYTVYAYVAEANRPQPVQDLQKRIEREARTPDVLAGSFEVANLPSGSYFLRLAVLNPDNEVVAEQARKFFVYNPAVARQQPGEMSEDEAFLTSLYSTMPEQEVEDALRHIQIIATERERRQAREQKDLDARRRFLAAFWENRDSDPQTAINEFRNEFYARLQYARERYANRFKEGWDTDRGRTYIKYGAPTAIEPHLYDQGTIPHEIWQYNNIPGEGQAFFVFADRGGFGELELLHASIAGERKSPNWEAELRRTR